MDLRRAVPGALAAALTLAVAGSAVAAHPHDHHGTQRAVAHKAQQEGGLGRIKHIVVVYEENHSFDNLYGGWEGVNGLASADAAHTAQVNQSGTPYGCLLQNDVNLTSPDPLASTCHDATTSTAFDSHFANEPFKIDAFIKPSDTTCPAPGVFAANGVKNGSGRPGGCTRDLVHRFYSEQYQINGGQQNRYTTGSDAAGLTQGYYDTKALPVYDYLHQPGHPDYAIADNFFQAAFGGSFLNHQWLIAAATPTFAGAVQDGSANDLHSTVDANGMPAKTPLYTPTGAVKDAQLTAKCQGLAKPGLLCGDYAVNTTQPWYQPYAPKTADARRLPPLTTPTIGDRLSAKGVDWAWYSGGWSNADGNVGAPGWTNGSGPSCSDPNALGTATYPNCPDKLFQFHHQPFNYYKNYAPGTEARAKHLRDEQEFLSLARSAGDSCNLKPVSFVKPIGAENEHPGYASTSSGSSHLVDVLKAVQSGGCADDTMVVVTYDENGGAWDHVPPPGQAGGPAGPSDQSGPGTRIPALVVAPGLRGDFVVDHAEHDTTSVLSTIEQRFDLAPLSSRDAAAPSLTSVFAARRPGGEGGDATGDHQTGDQADGGQAGN
jgi:acid phosphatase